MARTTQEHDRQTYKQCWFTVPKLESIDLAEMSVLIALRRMVTHDESDGLRTLFSDGACDPLPHGHQCHVIRMVCNLVVADYLETDGTGVRRCLPGSYTQSDENQSRGQFSPPAKGLSP